MLTAFKREKSLPEGSSKTRAPAGPFIGDLGNTGAIYLRAGCHRGFLISFAGILGHVTPSSQIIIRGLLRLSSRVVLRWWRGDMTVFIHLEHHVQPSSCWPGHKDTCRYNKLDQCPRPCRQQVLGSLLNHQNVVLRCKAVRSQRASQPIQLEEFSNLSTVAHDCHL